MSRQLDLVGQKFDRWEVIEKMSDSRNDKTMWKCRCTCGSGIEKIIPGGRLMRGDSRSCGCLRKEMCMNRKRETHPSWNGGRYIDDGGYVNIKMREHANADKQGYVLEHRFVIAEQRGYPLEPHEIVHHKNGVKTDNRIENLELCVIGITPHFNGQRVSDVKKECFDFLMKYATKAELQQWIDSIQQ